MRGGFAAKEMRGRRAGQRRGEGNGRAALMADGVECVSRCGRRGVACTDGDQGLGSTTAAAWWQQRHVLDGASWMGSEQACVRSDGAAA